MNEVQSSRPDKVRQAVLLLYITIGIGVVRGIMEDSRLAQRTSFSVIHVVLIQLMVFGVMLLLFYMIGKGRNWARITFLVMLIPGIPLSVLPLLQSLTASPFSGLLGVVQLVIQVLGLALLFQKPSSDWFREMKRAKQSSAS